MTTVGLIVIGLVSADCRAEFVLSLCRRFLLLVEKVQHDFLFRIIRVIGECLVVLSYLWFLQVQFQPFQFILEAVVGTDDVAFAPHIIQRLLESHILSSH